MKKNKICNAFKEVRTESVLSNAGKETSQTQMTCSLFFFIWEGLIEWRRTSLREQHRCCHQGALLQPGGLVRWTQSKQHVIDSSVKRVNDNSQTKRLVLKSAFTNMTNTLNSWCLFSCDTKYAYLFRFVRISIHTFLFIFYFQRISFFRLFTKVKSRVVISASNTQRLLHFIFTWHVTHSLAGYPNKTSQGVSVFQLSWLVVFIERDT